MAEQDLLCSDKFVEHIYVFELLYTCISSSVHYMYAYMYEGGVLQYNSVELHFQLHSMVVVYE